MTDDTVTDDTGTDEVGVPIDAPDRLPRRVWIGVAIGTVLALLAATQQDDGQAGLAATLLLASLATSVAAATLVLSSMVRAVRGHPNPTRRLWHVLGLFILTAVLTGMFTFVAAG